MEKSKRGRLSARKSVELALRSAPARTRCAEPRTAMISVGNLIESEMIGRGSSFAIGCGCRAITKKPNQPGVGISSRVFRRYTDGTRAKHDGQAGAPAQARPSSQFR